MRVVPKPTITPIRAYASCSQVLEVLQGKINLSLYLVLLIQNLCSMILMLQAQFYIHILLT